MAQRSKAQGVWVAHVTVWLAGLVVFWPALSDEPWWRQWLAAALAWALAGAALDVRQNPGRGNR